MFRNKFNFYGEELSTPRPTPKLEDHPLSMSVTAYSIYSQLPSILETVSPSATHQYCSGDKIEKNQMGGASSAYGGEERRIQGFGEEA